MKRWTQEEVDYLRNNWGKISMSGVAKKLGRSVNAIKIKAFKLGLGNMLEAGEYVTLNQFMREFNKTHFYTYNLKSWVESRGFPVKYKTIVKKKVRVVYIEEFWKWAEKNRDFLNFAKFEENIFGAEPQWVKEQRTLDFQRSLKFKEKPWTVAEDLKLKYHLKQFKYSYDDLSNILGRTCGAIQRRICDLSLKERPVKADNHANPWKDNDYNILNKGIKGGLSYEALAEQIGRSSKAIRGKVYTMYRTERLDMVRRVMCEKNITNTVQMLV